MTATAGDDSPVLVHNNNDNDKCGGGDSADGPEHVNLDRPSHFRKRVRDTVWENARENSTGQVRDPVTGQFMSKDNPWDMGHVPGHEFWRHQESEPLS